MRTSQSSQSEDRAVKQNKNPPQPKLDYRSMVSIDDMPALFVSFDSKYQKAGVVSRRYFVTLRF